MELKIIHSTIEKEKSINVDLIYIDPPFKTNRNFISYDDRWNNLNEYIDYISSLCYIGYSEWLNEGIFIIHLDYRTVHYMKVKLDELFGLDNFLNEIIWSYNSGGASTNKLSSKHDNLLVYKKGNYTFNILREPYATPNVENREGFHKDGRMLTDVWNISIISTTGKERTGYPTQKPVALLERIIKIYTNEGDTVLDYFAGSGTTGAAAFKLNRNCILIDKSVEAIKIIKERMGALEWIKNQ